MINSFIMFENLSITSALQALSYSFVPVLLGIVLHEVAHGYVAFKKGDPTASMMGRLTLNPIPHIDPLGLATFVLTAITSPFVFGWAKPIPVNGRYLSNPKSDLMWIAAAGPLANIALALIFGFLLKILIILLTSFPSLQAYSTSMSFLINMFSVGIIANIGLACINLIPIPPLDGSKILMRFLPNSMAYQYASLGRYGFIILIVLLVTGVLGLILSPIMQTLLQLIVGIFGINA